MKFYHGTSKENWLKIQEEGVLFGRRYVTDNDGNIMFFAWLFRTFKKENI